MLLDGEAAPVTADAGGAPGRKAQAAGLLSKFQNSGVAKKAADLIGPMLSAGSSPRSAGSASAAGDGAAPSPLPALSPFGSGTAAAGAAGVAASSTDGSCLSVQCCESPISMQGSVASVASHQPAAGAEQLPPAAASPSAAAYSSLSAAKKTFGKLFGGGGGSSDGTQPAAGSSPNGGGLIAAFRAIIPKTSGASTSERADRGEGRV